MLSLNQVVQWCSKFFWPKHSFKTTSSGSRDRRLPVVLSSNGTLDTSLLPDPIEVEVIQAVDGDGVIIQDSDGNVIATFTDGHITIEDGYEIRWNNPDSTRNSRIKNTGSTGNSNLEFMVGDGGAPTTKMALSKEGWLSVGTDSPSAPLHVALQNASLRVSSTSTSGYIGEITFDNTGMKIGHGSSVRQLQLLTNDTARVFIDGAGKVAIGGTDSWAAGLHVQAEIGIRSGIGAFLTSRGDPSIYSSADTFEGSTGNHGHLVLQSRSSASRDIILVTGTTPAERVRVNGNGNVGMGTDDIESWHSSWQAFQLGHHAAMMWPRTGAAAFHMLSNAYFDGAWKRRITDAASLIALNTGSIRMYAASSNSANTTISWTEVLRLTSDNEIVTPSNAALGEAWNSPSFNTGWGNNGSWGAVGYRKFGDMVMLRGVAARSSGSSSTIFTLPAGYRPFADTSFATPTFGDIQTIFVDSSGDVRFDSGGDPSEVHLDGVMFSI